jgi:HEAT repeat protein
MRWTLFASMLCSSLAPAQAGGDQPWRDKFARAVVIEEHEHDPARAALAYREVVAGARGELRVEASLRLGAALMTIGKRDEAQAAVAEALAAGGVIAARAHAVLDGQDQADKFLAKRVEAALATLRTHAGNGRQELLFLGRPAAPLIAARLRADLAAGIADQRTGGTLVEVLCLLGGKVSADFLSELASSSDLFARRLVAHLAGSLYANADFDSEVLAALALFTRDSDATIRAYMARLLGKRLPLARCVELAVDADPGVRQRAFVCLRLHLEALPAGVPCPDEVLQALRRGFDESDAGVCAELRQCLAAACVLRSSAGRRLAIEAVAHPTLGVQSLGSRVKSEVPNEHAGDFAAAAQKMASRGERLDRLAESIKQSLDPNEWNADAWPHVLAITDAGYRDAGHWLARWVGTDPVRAVQLVERLDKLAPNHISNVLSALGKMELPKEAFPPLEAWQDEPPQRAKAMLMTLVDDDRAAAWLLAAAGKTVSVTDVVRALLERQVNPRRDAVLVELAFHADLDLGTRQKVVVALCQRGNEKAIEQTGRAYEFNINVLGVDWAKLPDAVLARMVDLGLATGNELAFEAVTAQLSSANQNRRAVPAAVFDAVLRRTPECLVPASAKRVQAMVQLARLLRVLPITEAQRNDLVVRVARQPEALDVLIEAIPQSGPFPLPAEVLPALLTRLAEVRGQKSLIGGVTLSFYYVGAVSQVDAPNVPQVLRQLLKHPSEHVRGAAVPLVARLGDSAVSDLLPMLDDPAEHVRLAMVHAANDLPDPRFVPGLLRLMRSQPEQNREVIRKAIELIDFHANQTARWKRMLEGQGLDAPSAAEALVKQAKPGSDKPVRLAAIASLGTLKVPETLPVLVDLLRDADAEVRAAAEAALAKINAGGR